MRGAISVFVASRIAVLAVGYAALIVFGYPKAGAPVALYENELLNLPFRYDAGWYFRIASEGYTWNPADTGYQTIAFFPAFPMIVRFVMWMTGLRFVPAAMAVSLLAGVAGVVYVYRIARDRFSAEVGFAAVALLAAYPYAVFYSAPYSEPLFLCATAGAWYHFGKREWFRAVLLGLVAGLTRANGCLLAVPFGLMALRERKMVPWLAAAAPGIGMLLFSGYIYRLTGYPFQWSVAHEAWGRTYAPVGQLLGQWLDLPAHFRPGAGDVYLVDWVGGIAMLGVLASTVPIYRRLGLAMALYVPLTILPPLFAGGLLSMGRITAVIFPFFIWLASAVSEEQRPSWLVAFSTTQALAAAMFFTWRPLF
jgi:hypothetical protein